MNLLPALLNNHNCQLKDLQPGSSLLAQCLQGGFCWVQWNIQPISSSVPPLGPGLQLPSPGMWASHFPSSSFSCFINTERHSGPQHLWQKQILKIIIWNRMTTPKTRKSGKTLPSQEFFLGTKWSCPVSRAVGVGDREGCNCLWWLSSKSGKPVQLRAVFCNLFQKTLVKRHCRLICGAQVLAPFLRGSAPAYLTRQVIVLNGDGIELGGLGQPQPGL